MKINFNDPRIVLIICLLASLIAIIVCVVGLVFQLISIEKEKKNLSENSDILIDALKNKVNIINNWDK